MLIPQYFAGNETDANKTDDFEYGLGNHGDRFTTTPLRAPRVTENRLLFPLTLSTPPPLPHQRPSSTTNPTYITLQSGHYFDKLH